MERPLMTEREVWQQNPVFVFLADTNRRTNYFMFTWGRDRKEGKHSGLFLVSIPHSGRLMSSSQRLFWIHSYI